MTSLSEEKVRYGFPKKYKISFSLVFVLFYDFIHNFIVRFMYEDHVSPT